MPSANSLSRKKLSAPIKEKNIGTGERFIKNLSGFVKDLLNSTSDVSQIQHQIRLKQWEAGRDNGISTVRFYAQLKKSLRLIIVQANNIEEIDRVFELANSETQKGQTLMTSEETKDLTNALLERLRKAIKNELMYPGESLLANEIIEKYGLEKLARSIRNPVKSSLTVESPHPKSSYLKLKPQAFLPEQAIVITPVELENPTAKDTPPNWEPRAIETEFNTNDELIKFIVHESGSPLATQIIDDKLEEIKKIFPDNKKLNDLHLELLGVITATNFDGAAFDRVSANIGSTIQELDIAEKEIITRQLKNVKLEITLGHIVSKLIPDSKDTALQKKYRSAIANLLNPEFSGKMFQENLELLTKLSEIKDLGGNVELSILENLLNPENKKSTIEKIEKRLTHFTNIQSLTANKIEIPTTLILNPDNENNQAIASKAASYKAHEQNLAISYLTFETCEDANFKKLAEEFDTLLQNKEPEDYTLRGQIVDFLQCRSTGYSPDKGYTDRNLEAEKFIKNLIDLLKQKDPNDKQKTVGMFGVDKLFKEVYSIHTETRKEKSKDANFNQSFAGHYWHAKGTLELMKSGKYIVGISFKKYDDLLRELNKTVTNYPVSIKTTHAKDLKDLLEDLKGLKGRIQAKRDIRKSFTKQGKMETPIERELDVVYIEGDTLKFGEAKTSELAGKYADKRNNQSFALKEIADQFGATLEPLLPSSIISK